MEKKYKRTTVTSALPYANGPVHIGHLPEYTFRLTFMYVTFALKKKMCSSLAVQTNMVCLSLSVQRRKV